MPSESIKTVPNNENFLRYANQRELLANIDKKLDYHTRLKSRYPYINELRAELSQQYTKAKPTVHDYSDTPSDRRADSVMARLAKFESPRLSEDLGDAAAAVSIPKIGRQKGSLPVVGSERFRITVNEPPFGIYKKSGVGSLKESSHKN